MGSARSGVLLALTAGVMILTGTSGAGLATSQAAATLQARFSEQIAGTCGIAGFNATFIPTVSGGTSPYRYNWDFGDGSPNDTSESPTHAYRTVGPFVVTLTLTDAAGDRSNASQSVVNLAPGCPIRSPMLGLGFGIAIAVVALVFVAVYVAGVRRRRRPP